MKQPMNETLNFIPRRNSALVPPPSQTTAPAPMYSTRSCAEQGLCQGYKPPCQGCDWQTTRPWAPGTVEGPFTRTGIKQRFQRLAWQYGPTVVLWGCVALAAVWMVAFVSFWLGYNNPNFNLVGMVRGWFK